VFSTRFLYREVTSSQPAWAPKTRFEGKTFYFVRKSTWGITESPGAFCIGQPQNITRIPELTPPRQGGCTFLVTCTQRSHKQLSACTAKALRSPSFLPFSFSYEQRTGHTVIAVTLISSIGATSISIYVLYINSQKINSRHNRALPGARIIGQVYP
jgi:hypothetical protein